MDSVNIIKCQYPSKHTLSAYVLMGTNVFNQWFACIMKLASLLNHISVGGRVCKGRIRSPNIWGPSLLGAEFVRGRVCQGPSLLGAEMSRNPIYTCLFAYKNSFLCIFDAGLEDVAAGSRGNGTHFHWLK